MSWQPPGPFFACTNNSGGDEYFISLPTSFAATGWKWNSDFPRKRIGHRKKWQPAKKNRQRKFWCGTAFSRKWPAQFSSITFSTRTLQRAIHRRSHITKVLFNWVNMSQSLQRMALSEAVAWLLDGGTRSEVIVRWLERGELQLQQAPISYWRTVATRLT